MSRAALWLSMLADPGLFVFTDNVNSDTTNYNLRTRAVAAGWNQVQPLLAIITIASGIVVSANSTAVVAMDTGTTAYPPGSRAIVVNNGFVIGMGGAASGGTGGTALRVNLPVSFNNLGTIGGGGGGGGNGQTRTCTFPKDGGKTSIGLTGTGGSGGGGRTGRTNSSPNGTFASAGGGFGGGTQSGSSDLGTSSVTGGTGGPGGGWGSNGGGGNNATNSGGAISTSNSGPFGGGAAGVAVVGNANIEWVATGTRLGAIT